MTALQRCVVFALLCGVLLYGGCAWTYSYNEVMPNLDTTGTGQIVVVTHDQRPYVVSGGTNPTLVGLLRSPGGIPYPVYTLSGHPLADDMTEIICDALTSKGFQCVPVSVAASARPDEIQRKLQEYPGTRVMVLVLHEWKSDTYIATALAYDATLSVLDEYGALMAETHIQGRDVLEGSFWNSYSFASRLVPQALKKNLEKLLNDPTVIAALQTGNR